MPTRIVAAITPYLIWIALATGIAAGGAVIGWVQQVRLGHAKNQIAKVELERDRLKGIVADRDSAIAEFQRTQRELAASANRCSASVAAFAAQAEQRQAEAKKLADQIRLTQGPILRSITALTESLKAPGTASKTCADALAEFRAELRSR